MVKDGKNVLKMCATNLWHTTLTGKGKTSYRVHTMHNWKWKHAKNVVKMCSTNL
jgi:hypothetical protein